MEIPCFVTVKSRINSASTTYDAMKKSHAGTAPRCFILSNCSANFQTMTKGWAGGEPRGWTRTGLRNPQSISQIRAAISDHTASSNVGVGFFLQGLFHNNFGVHVDRGATRGEMKASPAPYEKTLCSHPRLRWGRNLARVFAAKFILEGDSRKRAAAHPAWCSCRVLSLAEVNGFLFCNAARHPLCRNLPAWLHRQRGFYAKPQRKDRSS